ncbi:MAG: metal ABC transporter permease [Patescibacteria group bacterium]|nr:metal ABC transporter permease [Patescibacteria group bacterium]
MWFFNPIFLAPIVTGAMLAAVLAWLGVFVVIKRMSFVADGIAHASLTGIAIGVLWHANPLYTALVFSLVVGLAIYFLERRTNLQVDAIITLLFTTSLAIGILLLGHSGQQLEALENALFGDISTITTRDMLTIVGIAAVVGIFLWRTSKHLALMMFDRATAKVAGIPVDRLELAFYLTIVITIVLGIKLFGVLLVGALMIIPASAAKLVSRSFVGAVTRSILFAVLMVMAGLPLAHLFDLSSGAVVVLTGSILFTFMMGVHRFAYVRRP